MKPEFLEVLLWLPPIWWSVLSGQQRRPSILYKRSVRSRSRLFPNSAFQSFLARTPPSKLSLISLLILVTRRIHTPWPLLRYIETSVRTTELSQNVQCMILIERESVIRSSRLNLDERYSCDESASSFKITCYFEWHSLLNVSKSVKGLAQTVVCLMNWPRVPVSILVLQILIVLAEPNWIQKPPRWLPLNMCSDVVAVEVIFFTIHTCSTMHENLVELQGIISRIWLIDARLNTS